MLKQPKSKVSLAIGAGVCALIMGGCFSLIKGSVTPEQSSQKPQQISKAAQGEAVQLKQINTLKALEPTKRKAKLESIARKPPNSLEGNRARYLLATELIQQGQGLKALEPLKDLENDYAVMAAPVLTKRAQAYEQIGETAKAQTTWQEILKRDAKNPMAAEALLALGKTDSRYLDQAIAQFPSHPRVIEMARQRLQQNPKQLPLLLLIAQHGLHLPEYVSILDRLTSDYTRYLKPEDWEAIGFGYWEKQDYGKAGMAYARAPYTPFNAYRIARGLHLGERSGTTLAYQRIVQDFPDAQETGLALMRLSRIVQPTQAIPYLDQVIQRFPDRAAEALLEKAKVLDALDSKKTASQVRQILLTEYPSSDAAAELRWSLAKERANARDFQTAKQWALPILTSNSESEIAPEAGFWAGKWATQLGQEQEARTAYQQVIAKYPQSYYAWRSASMLGWQVGDFNTVRQFNPQVERPASRPDLPAGSETLKELYQLGLDQDAWKLWQVEFQNKIQPTVAEQFTDGIMRQGVGDYLDGIFMVSYLREREQPEDQNQYRELKRQKAYWEALYPFPYMESIENWSQERQLNPLLVTALIRQESRFMPRIRSVAGATGLMQVMPDTGMWIAKQIKLKEYKLDQPDDNIKLGTWYLDYTHEEYNGNSMLAVASYNAGPGAVAGWVAKKGGTDVDAFVETIPYDETRGYVKSVFENYWNYLRLYNPEISQRMAQISAEHPKDDGES